MKGANKNAVERQIERMLQGLPHALRYGSSNPPKVKRCPVCVSSLAFKAGRWECPSCRYRSEEKNERG